ncbi:hypothetical protein BD779DRAFT_1539207 [Infundibulicybe gibba]|nr:hypothetical protein BD779DRAFT_1539207 [Infundibulicybe gibba]
MNLPYPSSLDSPRGRLAGEHYSNPSDEATSFEMLTQTVNNKNTLPDGGSKPFAFPRRCAPRQGIVNPAKLTAQNEENPHLSKSKEGSNAEIFRMGKELSHYKDEARRANMAAGEERTRNTELMEELAKARHKLVEVNRAYATLRRSNSSLRISYKTARLKLGRALQELLEPIGVEDSEMDCLNESAHQSNSQLRLAVIQDDPQAIALCSAREESEHHIIHRTDCIQSKLRALEDHLVMTQQQKIELEAQLSELNDDLKDQYEDLKSQRTAFIDGFEKQLTMQRTTSRQLLEIQEQHSATCVENSVIDAKQCRNPEMEPQVEAVEAEPTVEDMGETMMGRCAMLGSAFVHLLKGKGQAAVLPAIDLARYWIPLQNTMKAMVLSNNVSALDAETQAPPSGSIALGKRGRVASQMKNEDSSRPGKRLVLPIFVGS